MASLSSSRARQVGGGKKIAMALGVALFFIALVIAVYVMSSGEPSEANRGQTTAANKETEKKVLPAMNLALGNVVTVISELGFTVKGVSDGKNYASRVAAKIDNQLAPLRELFRDESEKQPALMGGLLVELTVGPYGEVTQVREISTRIANGQFRRSVLAAVYKWEFKDILPEGATVLCPLLFVREGMDITTLVKWEKHLGLFDDKNLLSRAVPAPNPVTAPVPLTSNPPKPNTESKAPETPPEKLSAQRRGSVPSNSGKKPVAAKASAATTKAMDGEQVERALRATARAENGEM